MNNNKGQTFVLFVFLLPVILGLVAYLVDSGLMMYEDNKLDRISEVVLDYSIKNKSTITSEKIRKMLTKNDKDIVINEIVINEEYISIETTKEFDSLFGKVLGIDKYKVKSNMKEYKE